MAKSGAQRTREYRARIKARQLLQLVSRKPVTERYTSKLSHIEWTKKYCGYTWDTPYLREIAEKLWISLKVLVFIPRGHGKTFLAIALLCKYLLEHQKPVVLITSGSAQQRRLFRRIVAILNSPAIKDDYGEIIGSANRSTCEIQLREDLEYTYLDPLLRVATRGSDLVGSHPTWIHIEDLIQEPFKSDESNESLIEWWGGIVEFCLTYEAGHETKITGTGTRKDKGDFWEHLLEVYHYPAYVRKALTLVKGTFPTKKDIIHQDEGRSTIDISKGTYTTLACRNWPLSKLLIERIYKPERFMAEMQNDPMPRGGLYFSLDDWIEIDDIPPHSFGASAYYMAVDPAFGRGQRADYTAIIVCGLFRGKLYVVDGVYERGIDGMDVDRMLSEIIRLAQQYQVKNIWIESNNFQFLIAKQLSLRGNISLPITELTNLTKKIIRINALKPYFISEKILICPSPIESGLKTEYTAYNQMPSTAHRKDDALDALEMIVSNLVYHLESNRQRIKAGWI